jgi:hypothetical protein
MVTYISSPMTARTGANCGRFDDQEVEMAFRIAISLLILILFSACASAPKQYKPKSNFTEFMDHSFSARNEPAKVRFLEVVPKESAFSKRIRKKILQLKMFKKGLALIGTIEHEQVINTCKYEKGKVKAECEEVGGDTDAQHRMQANAAGRGGDIILVSKFGNVERHRRTSNVCVKWKTNSYAQPIFNYGTGIYSYKTRTVSWDQCEKYEAILENIVDSVQKYTADVYRFEPELAQRQIFGLQFELFIAEGNNEKLRQLIKSGAPVDTATLAGHVPITLSALYNNLGAAKILITQGADINHMTIWGTPLHVAAGSADAPFVNYLLQSGAVASLRNEFVKGVKKGSTALHFAALNGKADIIPLLINAGLDVDSRTDEGVTPLMLAAYENRSTAVKKLIQLGANVNEMSVNPNDKQINNALLFGVLNNSTESVKVLLESGADYNLNVSNKGGSKYTIQDSSKELLADDFEQLGIYRLLFGQFGYIDIDGRIMIKPKYDQAGPFSEGLARAAEQVSIYVGNEYKYGYINKKGKYRIKPKYTYATDFKSGVATVRVGGDFYFIDKSDRNICGGKTFRYAGEFHDGYAQVRLDSGERRFISRKCKFLNAVPFAYANDFSEGLAAVEIDGKWGYMNTNGQLAIRPGFYWAGDFKGGLAQFKAEAITGDLIGFIDKQGKVVIEPQFNTAGNFGIGNGKYVYATKGFMGKTVWVDRKGNIVPKETALAPDPEYKQQPIIMGKDLKYKVKGIKQDQILVFSEGLAPVQIRPF